MKAFTLDLSKEAMLLLQLKLPKGYSLVRTTKQSKKGGKTSKYCNLSGDSANHDFPSQEFEPNKTSGKPKTSRNPPAKTKELSKAQTAKKITKSQITQSQNEQMTSKKPQKSFKKSKEESQIFDSDSQEDTNSEPKAKLKAKVKQEKLQDKTEFKEIPKGKKEPEKLALNSAKTTKNNNQPSKDNSGLFNSREIIPQTKRLKGIFKDQNQDHSREETTQEKQLDSKDSSKQNLLKIYDETQKKAEQNQKAKNPKPKQKKYSYDDRLQIIARIRKFDKSTMADFFKAIQFSKGETLDFKLMEDDKIKSIEEQLIKYEEIYNEKMKLEREKLKTKNPKSLEDFEVAEDNDYDD